MDHRESKILFPKKNSSQLLTVNSSMKNIFVISDLHLASGLNNSNNYEGTENFFADQSFVRFIDELEKRSDDTKALLAINGDFIDFLRICEYPQTDQDFANWKEMLNRVQISKSQTELRASIVKKEKIFGLKTNDFKSVWKLDVCIKGHLLLFQRLALWLHHGNDLIITKGNHDLEWYWEAVQNYLLLTLSEISAVRWNLPFEAVFSTTSQQIVFADNSVLIDHKIYIEHGHRYENTTTVYGDALTQNQQELNLPFGSFFNRYLINKIELVYPFIDNVRPRQDILLILFRERFLLALKMVFCYVPFVLLLIPKKLWWAVFKYTITFLLIVVTPIAITGYGIYKSWPHTTNLNLKNVSWLVSQVISAGKNLGFLFLSYLFGRIMVLVKLSGPVSFKKFADDIFNQNQELSVVTFGHTHNPEQKNNNGHWYLNSGTWMPIFEASSTDIRIDKTYTFLHFYYDSQQKLVIQPLQRWNDDACRYDKLTLIETA
jgi:UDP-2,3-diacylglucosamine pyrophosphatase LpxH